MSQAISSFATEERISVAGVDARVQIAGDGPPILFLHGSNGTAWTPGLQALAGRFRVYQPEHSGFGETERPDWIETVRDVALYYLDLIEALGLRQLNLIGQSLGGWIAADLATYCSHPLRRLVLTGAAGLALPGEKRLDQFAMAPDSLIRALYHDQAIADRMLSVEPTAEQIHAQVRNRGMTARLGWSPYMADPSLRGRLHRVRVPTLLVWGAQDRLVPPSHLRAYAEALPQARVALVEACGHLPAVEQSVEFARLVSEFLAEGD